MKKIIKLSLLMSFSLALQNQIWQNLTFQQPVWTIIKVALILALFEIILKPLIKILLLPINLITLGFFRIIINTMGFYLAVFLLSDFQVNPIHTQAITFQNIIIPALNISGFWVFVVNSTTQNFLLSVFKSIIRVKKDKK